MPLELNPTWNVFNFNVFFVSTNWVAVQLILGSIRLFITNAVFFYNQYKVEL